MAPPKRLDAVIPIVFPDYEIKVSERVTIGIELDPVEIFGVDIFNGFKYKGPEVFDGKIGGLGHAGVLFISGAGAGAKGQTKYYEYGRYDKAEMGITRRVAVPDVTLGADGRATRSSLTQVLARISAKAGHGTRIAGVYIEVPGKFDEMLAYAGRRLSANKNPKRDAYSIWTNSCLHFAIGTMESAGVASPWFADPSPSSYAEVLQGSFPDLSYDPKTGIVTIEAGTNVPEWAGKGH
jgi:hypothetical protein